ncbi:MAG: carboxypeptidase-like regulatory domain-containing protein [Chloroflexi bacterium]|nr:carboxypeptidase-like regulatory domain-containing protein [Chloroflexota bacterium]
MSTDYPSVTPPCQPLCPFYPRGNSNLRTKVLDRVQSGGGEMVLNRRGVASLAILGAVLAAAFALACGSSDADRFEERWAELGIPEAEFVFLGEFASGEQESVRRELRVAQVVFAEHFGAVSSDFKVYVSTDLEMLNERLTQYGEYEYEYRCGGVAPRRAIFLALGECPEAQEYGPVLAHEYFHMLQYAAGTFSRPIGEVWWTVDGTAAYAQALFNDAQGRRTLAAWRQGKQLAWSAGLVEGPRWAYDYGFLATDWLVERAGAEAVLEFFRLGGHHAAFRSAFGMSPVTFQAMFGSYLAGVAPRYEWRVGGTVLDDDGAPVEGAHVSAVVRIEGEAWMAATGLTDPQGNFEFPAPGSGYRLAFWLQCPGAEDDVQWVRAGEWGEDGFVADADGTWDGLENGAEPFTDGGRDRTGMVIELSETQDSLIAKHCES